MKTRLFFMLIAIALGFSHSRGQCGMFSLIGEFNSWSDDEFLTRDPINPDEFTLMLYLTMNDDSNGDGLVEMKFRENADWANTYGSTQFPTGVAYLNGPNIPVVTGSYRVTFNCITLHYSFESVCGQISLIGEFNGWSGDLNLQRNHDDDNLWKVIISLDSLADLYGDDEIIEMKFRENADWTVNWGDDAFPSGIGTLNGPNIWVPLTTTGISTDYVVDFNCSSGEYNFTETCGPISIYGEFSNWESDISMERDAENPSLFTVLLSLNNTGDDQNGDGIIELKFRENQENTLNWGATAFPSGTGTLNGPGIPVPLDNTGLTSDYRVTFNYSTGAYTFQATAGAISIIGAFNGWLGDLPMNRSEQNPNLWTLTRSWTGNSDIKFRENNDWWNNWGDDAWPSGVATPNGLNVPVVAGIYDITFNSSTLAYNFATNPDACGEISLVGDFNEWGGSGDIPTDIYLIRSVEYPSQFSLDYPFDQSTELLFRLDADPTFTEVWGGSSLCQTGVQDNSMHILVPSGYYHITFDYNSGDYCFTNLGKTLQIPKVLSMNVDGNFEEVEWDVSQSAEKLYGEFISGDLNVVTFDVVYSEQYLYVAVNVEDASPTPYDYLELFLDGDHSGGPYDVHDVHFTYDPNVGVQIVDGPPGGMTILSGFAINPNGDGLRYEFGIPWEPLGVSPAEGDNAGFDLFAWDDDYGGWPGYLLAWSGTLGNLNDASSLGKLDFGPVICGCISLFNPTIGDVRLRPTTDQPSNYLASYELYSSQSLVFRKDFADGYTWGSPDFPVGTGEHNGPPIPALQGRYRVNFNCETGAYVFSSEIPPGSFALAYYADVEPVIDGQLDEYELNYESLYLVAGTGPINNTVNWGAAWDEDNLYIGVSVTDQAILGSGSPWDNDAIEFYLDGNNDKDGAYDPDFDTQIIVDVLNQSVPWFRADGVPITNYSAALTFVDGGYNVELRLGWDNIDFEPGRGRNIGWSLGNDDNDNNVGRDYQSVWYGSDVNWNNTSQLGEIQLANGPYFVDIKDLTNPENLSVFPNPSDGPVSVILKSDPARGRTNVKVFDISGKLLFEEQSAERGNSNVTHLDFSTAGPGLYLVTITTEKGDYYVKKLVIH